MLGQMVINKPTVDRCPTVRSTRYGLREIKSLNTSQYSVISSDKGREGGGGSVTPHLAVYLLRVGLTIQYNPPVQPGDVSLSRNIHN